MPNVLAFTPTKEATATVEAPTSLKITRDDIEALDGLLDHSLTLTWTLMRDDEGTVFIAIDGELRGMIVQIVPEAGEWCLVAFCGDRSCRVAGAPTIAQMLKEIAPFAKIRRMYHAIISRPQMWGLEA